MEVPLLVDDFLRRSVQLYPAKTAVVDNDLRFTYAELQARVNRLSHALLKLGVEPDDRVCILSPNSHFFLESFFATSQIGAVLVPLNYRLVAADHEYILNHAGVSVVLVDHEYTDIVDGIRANLTTVEHFIVARDGSDTLLGLTPDGWQDWETLIAGEPTSAPPAVARDENDLVSINYTSGTTARPKGVMLTHRNCTINAYSLIAHLRVSHDDVELWTLPMFHCNGWGGVYAITGMGGTHVVLRAVDGAEIFRLIERERVTFACMAPTVLRTILDYPDRAAHTIETKPRFIVAGAPPPGRLHRPPGERTRLGVHRDLRPDGDGAALDRQPHGLQHREGRLPAPLARRRARDRRRPRRARRQRPARAEGQHLGRRGLRPVQRRLQGLLGAARKETAKAIRDGYFHTGDLAVWDEVGSIHIVDRKKDVIISGGENISSPDIEDVLYRHPSVLECAVIGVPHEKWGETPKALVVQRDGSNADEAEIIAFCRDNLAHFKCPTSVEFRDELPRTATGKLQKFKLREPYWSSERRVG